MTDSRFSIEHYLSLASTNDLARDRALGGAPEGLVIRAEAQTKGRGRHGRVWQSPKGNLHVSILLRPRRPLMEAATLSLVLGLSLAETLEAEALAPELTWPNDVMVEGAKLAGILLESLAGPTGDPVIIAGMGVNVATCPTGLPYPATSLAALGIDQTPADLLNRFLARFAPDYDLWQERGFPAFRERWLRRAHGRGRDVGVREGHGVARGRFVDVDALGRLVIDSPAGRRLIHAGELFFPHLEDPDPARSPACCS